jgi:predicted amidohydrolase
MSTPASDNVTIAIVQPQSYLRGLVAWVPGFFDEHSPPERHNLTIATDYIAQAAAAGAQVVAFPETYPGPSTRTLAWDYDETVQCMQQSAREHHVYVLCGGSRRAGETAYNVCTLVGPQGDICGTHTKVIPACGEPIAPGASVAVIRTPLLTIGILICMEAWYPELARILAFQGADIIFYPTGGLIYDLRDTWRTILQARAAENTLYTAASTNIFGVEQGMGYIFSPERQEAELLDVGIAYATLDLARLRYLRSTDEQIIVPKKYRVVPGLLRSLRPAVAEMYSHEATTAAEHETIGQYEKIANWRQQQ